MSGFLPMIEKKVLMHLSDSHPEVSLAFRLVLTSDE